MKAGNGVLCCYLELLAAPDLPPVLEPSHLKGWSPCYLTLEDNIRAFKCVHRARHLAKNRRFYKKKNHIIMCETASLGKFLDSIKRQLIQEGGLYFFYLVSKYMASPLKNAEHISPGIHPKHSESQGQYGTSVSGIRAQIPPPESFSPLSRTIFQLSPSLSNYESYNQLGSVQKPSSY